MRFPAVGAGKGDRRAAEKTGGGGYCWINGLVNGFGQDPPRSIQDEQRFRLLASSYPAPIVLRFMEELDKEVADVVEELDKEECSSQKRRRSRSNDNLLEAFKEVGLAMGSEIKESTIKLTEAMGYDVTVTAKKVKINEELLKLPTISMFERHKSTLQIARDHETTDVFFTIADDEKEEWVKALLRGDI
ncbi:hypothetical protein F0562_003729 [Nyssa sinensis]|uniref:Uncharacterized protein n=1 Tax=Nyssa sinensis TaxID=561372 RepID=A0A5J5C0G2_9ASTE|nr:hypothetical protein F0562_003729 [Nyssa sinensis]